MKHCRFGNSPSSDGVRRVNARDEEIAMLEGTTRRLELERARG